MSKFITQSLFFCVFTLGLSGCGGVYSQSVQVDDNAYILLTGDSFDGKVLVINDEQEVHLMDRAVPVDGNTSQAQNNYVKTVRGRAFSFDLNGKNAIKIEIPAGKHNVKIYDNGNLVVNRDFYVSTETSFEVTL